MCQHLSFLPFFHVWRHITGIKVTSWVLWSIKSHTSSDLNKPHNNTIGTAVMPRVTSAERNNAIERLQVVARNFDVSKQTISSLWLWYNITQSVNDRSRSSHHRVTTTTIQDRYIRIRHLRNRTRTATTTVTQILVLRRISHQTVRHRLWGRQGFSLEYQYDVTFLTPRHLAERLQWTK